MAMTAASWPESWPKPSAVAVRGPALEPLLTEHAPCPPRLQLGRWSSGAPSGL